MRFKEPGRRRAADAGKTKAAELIRDATEPPFDIRQEATPELAQHLRGEWERNLDDFLQSGSSNMQAYFEFYRNLNTYTLLFPDEPVVLPARKLEKLQQVLVEWLKDSRSESQTARLSFRHYVNSLATLLSVFPPAREFHQPSSLYLPQFWMRLTDPAWRVTKEQVEPWIKTLESYGIGKDLVPGDFRTLCDSILVLSVIAPETKPRLRALAERCMKNPPKPSLGTIEFAERIFPVVAVFPELQDYFPYTRDHIPELKQAWKNSLYDKEHVDVSSHRNALTKALIGASSGKIRVEEGKIRYTPQPVLPPSVALPQRPLV